MVTFSKYILMVTCGLVLSITISDIALNAKPYATHSSTKVLRLIG